MSSFVINAVVIRGSQPSRSIVQASVLVSSRDYAMGLPDQPAYTELDALSIDATSGESRLLL
jgi:hypothetical protein